MEWYTGLPSRHRCGWIKNVIIWTLFHKLDLVLFSLAKPKCENYNLLWYQQFKMFCLDPVCAIGYQHSSWFCFSWLLVYYPQFHSLNLCLKTILQRFDSVWKCSYEFSLMHSNIVNVVCKICHFKADDKMQMTDLVIL